MTNDKNISAEITLNRSQLIMMTLLIEGLMLVAGVGIALWRDASFWQISSVTSSAVLLGIVSAVPPLVIIIGISESDTKLGALGRENFGPVIGLFKNVSILDIAFVSIMAGLSEEALFRGALQTFVADHMGIWAALAIISILFGFVHFLSLTYFVFATLIGLYLGILYVWTDSLLVPILSHAVYDFVALVYGTRFMRKNNGSGIEHAG
ncbi:MAG: type II CAAX endopeptidase family protein [Candidatus Hydrogenedentota bacterium]